VRSLKSMLSTAHPAVVGDAHLQGEVSLPRPESELANPAHQGRFPLPLPTTSGCAGAATHVHSGFPLCGLAAGWAIETSSGRNAAYENASRKPRGPRHVFARGRR